MLLFSLGNGLKKIRISAMKNCASIISIMNKPAMLIQRGVIMIEVICFIIAAVLAYKWHKEGVTYTNDDTEEINEAGWFVMHNLN